MVSVNPAGKAVEAVKDFTSFISSLTTLDMPPGFTAIVPINHFSVERIFAKRRFYRSLHNKGGAQLVCTEVQELFLRSLNEPNANLEATCSSREEMIAQHRLWWEAHVDGLSDPAEICEVAEKMVSQMDGIGYSNRGSWEHEPEQPEDSAPAETPFW